MPRRSLTVIPMLCVLAVVTPIVPGEAADRESLEENHAVAPVGGAGNVRIQEINEPFAAPTAFERTFDFDLLPFAGSFSSRTLDGITVNAPTTNWVHLDGSPMPGRVARQPDSPEFWDILVPPGTHALELRLWESTIPGVAANSCFNFGSCGDTRYQLRVFRGNTLLRSFLYLPDDDRENRLVVWSSVNFDRIEFRAQDNNFDDEFLGDIRTSSVPLPAGYPQRVAARDGAGFGTTAAVHAGLALVGDNLGFDTLRIDASGTWQRTGRRALGAVDLAAMQGQRAVLALEAGGTAQRLAFFDINGDDPAAWPLLELPYSGTARALDLHGDLAVLGFDAKVAVYRRDPVAGWRFEYDLVPDPPIAGATFFGGSLGLDGNLLVVGVGSDMFHLFRRNQGADFVEVFRQDVATAQGTQRVDVSGDTVVQQGRAGNLRLFRPDGAGDWSEVQNAFEALPIADGLGLANGVRIDGDRMVALQSFRPSGTVQFRQAVSIWLRQPGGGFERAGVFVDPHIRGASSAGLGNSGRALALHRQHLVMGQPFTPWCDNGATAQFGDPGSLYGSTCGGRSGAALLAQVSALVALFADGFESTAD